MPQNDRTKIARSREEELSDLNTSVGSLIRRRFGLWGENPELLESCAKSAGKTRIKADEASAVIIGQVWNKLRQLHSFRVID
jgi:hypothetical protein